MALPPVRQPIAPVAGPDGGRMAAQKAFFQAALGKPAATAPPPAAAPTFAPQTPAAPQTLLRAGALPDEPPKKILRPGSLLDIRV